MNGEYFSHQPAINHNGIFVWVGYPNVIKNAMSVKNWVKIHMPAYAAEQGIL
jgi:hypothetical protein